MTSGTPIRNPGGAPIRNPESCRPYRLRSLMRSYGLRQRDIRIEQPAGFGRAGVMSAATFSLLVNRHIWPKSPTRDCIEASVREALQKAGANDDEIAGAWEIDHTFDPTDDKAIPRTSYAYQKPSAPAVPVPESDPFQFPEPEMLSATARQTFNITRHPFLDDIQGPQDLFLSKDQRYIRESMYQAAKHGGFLAVIGESGSGKSTLRRDLLERIRRDNESIVIIQPQTVDKTELTSEHICDAIVSDLSIESPKLSKEAKARHAKRILSDSARAGNANVLIIEEAHDLKISTLKFLKRFWELEDGFKKLLGIILVGQPELGKMLNERTNYAAREVIRRCEVAHLNPLNGNLEDYLTLKFKRVGMKLDEVFAGNAFDAIRARLTFRAQGSNEVESHVYPLVVHNLVITCLNRAADLGMDRIDADLVGKV